MGLYLGYHDHGITVKRRVDEREPFHGLTLRRRHIPVPDIVVEPDAEFLCDPFKTGFSVRFLQVGLGVGYAGPGCRPKSHRSRAP